jgi:hypothetical protein
MPRGSFTAGNDNIASRKSDAEMLQVEGRGQAGVAIRFREGKNESPAIQ